MKVIKYKLKDIFDLQMGKTPSRNNLEYWNTEDYKWISIADLSKVQKYISDTKEYLSKKAIEESGIKVIPANTIIMSFKLSIGKTAITTENMYSNEAIMAFKDKNIAEIIPDYIFYMFKYKDWNEGSNKAVMGKTLNKATLSEIEIEIQTIEKQKEIVKILDKVSNIIELQQQKLKYLDDLMKARFVELFGDLVIGDKISKNKHKIGEIASVTKLAGFEFTKYIEYKEQGDIIMLRGLNCKKGKLILDDVKWIDKDTSNLLPRSKLYYGDILMTYAGTIGDVAMIDEDDKYHLAPNVAKITLNDKKKYNSVFLMYLFIYTNQYIMTFASQVAQASINMEKIRNFEYFFPDIELQNQFANFVAKVDKSKVVVQKALEETQLLFDSLMQEYFG